jgi:hypothetical protein
MFAVASLVSASPADLSELIVSITAPRRQG